MTDKSVTKQALESFQRRDWKMLEELILTGALDPTKQIEENGFQYWLLPLIAATGEGTASISSQRP